MSVSTESFLKKHLTNVTEWQKMGKAHVFPPESNLELINGEIIGMAPIGSRHASYLKRLIKLFSGLIKNSQLLPPKILYSAATYQSRNPACYHRAHFHISVDR